MKKLVKTKSGVVYPKEVKSQYQLEKEFIDDLNFKNGDPDIIKGFQTLWHATNYHSQFCNTTSRIKKKMQRELVKVFAQAMLGREIEFEELC